MKYKRRMILSIFWILLGIVLFLLGVLEYADSFWSGMGGGLLAVGALQTVRHIRYMSDKSYKEKMDIANKDERTRFISGRAWAWAGYCFVLIGGIGTVVFKLIGREDMMQLAAGTVCLILLLYWLSYMILNKKY